MRRRLIGLLLVAASAFAACGGSDSDTAAQPADATGGTAAPAPPEFGPAPAFADGALPAELVGHIDTLFLTIETTTADTPLPDEVVTALGEAGDARLGWILSDVLRFFQGSDFGDAAVTAAERLTGATIDPERPWSSFTDHMIAWDIPAPPDYAATKFRIFGLVEPRWEPFFTDPDSEIDYRYLSWGGVGIDDRVDATGSEQCRRGCIPALDDPAVTDAAGGSWYPDDRLVFGVVIDGEARAYPKNIMEVHEMVNDTIGGRRIALPYCTLCGSAQVFLTEDVPDGVRVPVLRTSGLLSRSNKVMYDLETFSAFDTFAGRAVTGPLLDAGVVLTQADVVTSTWADWREAHPDTTIVAEDGGIGRTYDLDPLGGRDDDGPIFPVGDVDPRLPVQAQVLGVVTADGVPLAFPVEQARTALDAGGPVELEGVRLVADGSGVRAELADGGEISGHQAFWFAWSQFNPDTLVWEA